MPKDDAALIERIAAGDKLTEEAELPAPYRAELMRLMTIFVDSELAGAAGFVAFINSAPGMRERTVAATIVSQKFAHAEQVLGLMQRFGVAPTLYVREHAWEARLNRAVDLGNRRVGGDKRLNIFHYPLEGWVDAVAMNFAMGMATAVQLGDLPDCSYAPLAQAMAPIVEREREHAVLGEKGLEQAIERGNGTAAQVAIDYWYPRVLATFGRLDTDHVALYQRYGLRRGSNAELAARWQQDMATRLPALGLAVPRAG